MFIKKVTNVKHSSWNSDQIIIIMAVVKSDERHIITISPLAVTVEATHSTALIKQTKTYVDLENSRLI